MQKNDQKSRKHLLWHAGDSQKICRHFFRTRQLPLAVTSSTWQTSQLVKLTWQVDLTSWLVTLPSCPASNDHLTSFNLWGWLVKLTWQIIISAQVQDPEFFHLVEWVSSIELWRDWPGIHRFISLFSMNLQETPSKGYRRKDTFEFSEVDFGIFQTQLIDRR